MLAGLAGAVLVGFETFAGRVCEIADRTVITPGTLAALLDQALIERVVFDGPARALEVRDRRCGHEGCHVPGHRCHADHIHRRADGGPTTLDNGQLRCGYHNQWRELHPDHPNAHHHQQTTRHDQGKDAAMVGMCARVP